MMLLLQFARDGVWPLVAALAAAARSAAAGRRTRRRCRRAQAAARRTALLRGAARAQAVRRAGRGQRPEVRDTRRRDPRPDRSQRRRQEHDVQPDQRRAAADRGEVVFRGERSAARPRRRSPALGIARTFQHVQLMPRDDGARQRRAGRVPARPQRASRARRCGSTARRKRALLAEAARADRARRPRPTIVRRRRQPAAGQAADRRDRARAGRRPALLLLDEPAAGLRYLEKQALADAAARSCKARA